MLTQRADLTFKHNLKQGRHGWLRLTPAYSIKVAQEILDHSHSPQRILDPFSGTGTTGLVCAERDLKCDLVELNPFLVWLARAKTRNYTLADITSARQLAGDIHIRVKEIADKTELWIPTIHQIERWWPAERLATLSRIFYAIQSARNDITPSAIDLSLISFCRLLIDWSNAAFNHQSMSFKETRPTLFDSNEQTLMLEAFMSHLRAVISAAESQLPGKANVYHGDSRSVDTIVSGPYDVVITSPPYPNRISYIRELRPYMYWLGYLKEGREAGELDWQAIGGTWGIATSRLQQWQANGNVIAYDGFEEIIARIAENSPVLARYVHKYFIDISNHLSTLKSVLARGARVYYIIGNSKFYDVVVPVEHIYASLFMQAGFTEIQIKELRKRNSKKELVEFCVQAKL